MVVDGKEETREIAFPPAKGMASTPTVLADTAVRFIGVEDGASWLDPSAGSGQLVRSLIRAGVPAQDIMTVDLQTQIPMLQNLGTEHLLGTDFLEWAKKTKRRFDRIIANPPFVPLSELEASLARSALSVRTRQYKLTLAANYWVAFLLAGMKLLNPGGTLAYILPAAWEYADYASPIRRLCETSFRELDVHRVLKPMFDEVEDGSVLLVGRGYREQQSRATRVFRYASLKDLTISSKRKSPSAKYSVSITRERNSPAQEGEVCLGDIATIQIGAVTGDANYFLVNEAQRIELGLPLTAVRPILTKARHIAASEIDQAVWRRLLANGQRVWLFAPNEDETQHPSIRAYLEREEQYGGCNREALKVRNRHPWYSVNIPRRFDGFLSGMSHCYPWVALNRMPNLTASNTLYGVRFRRSMSIDEQAAWCMSMLSSRTAESRAQWVRQYPQGLHKLEPGDIAKLVVRWPKKVKGARTAYHRVVELIRSGKSAEAQATVDCWLHASG